MSLRPAHHRDASSPISARPRAAPGWQAGLPGLALVVLLLCAAPAAAQETSILAGRVLEEGTERPVAGASMRVGEVASIVTDEDGRFRIGGLEPGRHAVSVHYLGFEAATRRVELEPAGSKTITLHLRPEVIELAEIVVDIEGPRGAWMRSDLRDLVRQHGRVYTASDLAEMSIARLPSLLYRIPGLRHRFVDDWDMGGRRLILTSAHRPCEARVYLDGGRVPSWMLETVPVDDVAAIGILARPTSSALVQCGLISIITRATAAREAGPTGS